MEFSQANKVLSSFTTPIQLIGPTSGPTTGISRYCSNLQQALLAQGIAVTLSGTKLPPLPPPLVKLGRRANFDLRGFFTTYPLLLPSQPAKAITHLTSQNQASAALLSRRKRLVITVHDMITLTSHADPEIVNYLKPYAKFFNDMALPGLKKADMLLADSEHTREAILTRIKYPAERVKVIYPGLDHNNFQPKTIPADFYQRYKLAPHLSYLLYVGSEDPRKNLQRLIEAFARLNSKFPELHLIKLGTNWFAHERQKLLTQIEQLGLNGKVIIFDHVQDEDLAFFYNLARLFVFPSLLEGFGWPPLEALACGTPVIASNISCIPEVLGEAAIYFDPYQVEEIASNIALVLTDQELATKLHHQGPLRASGFTWEKTVSEVLTIYRQFAI